MRGFFRPPGDLDPAVRHDHELAWRDCLLYDLFDSALRVSSEAVWQGIDNKAEDGGLGFDCSQQHIGAREYGVQLCAEGETGDMIQRGGLNARHH